MSRKKALLALVVVLVIVAVLVQVRSASGPADGMCCGSAQPVAVAEPQPTLEPEAMGPPPAPQADTEPSVEAQAPPAPASADVKLPRLVDIGAGKCIPCKMMVPELEALRTRYAGSLVVDLIDITTDQATAEKYGVRIIPTQIFFDAEGKELGRHQGFMTADDMVAEFAQHGVRLQDEQKAAD